MRIVWNTCWLHLCSATTISSQIIELIFEPTHIYISTCVCICIHATPNRGCSSVNLWASTWKHTRHCLPIDFCLPWIETCFPFWNSNDHSIWPEWNVSELTYTSKLSKDLPKIRWIVVWVMQWELWLFQKYQQTPQII